MIKLQLFFKYNMKKHTYKYHSYYMEVLSKTFSTNPNWKLESIQMKFLRKTKSEFLIYKSTNAFKKRGKELYNISCENIMFCILLRRDISIAPTLVNLRNFSWNAFSTTNYKLNRIIVSVSMEAWLILVLSPISILIGLLVRNNKCLFDQLLYIKTTILTIPLSIFFLFTFSFKTLSTLLLLVNNVTTCHAMLFFCFTLMALAFLKKSKWNYKIISSVVIKDIAFLVFLSQLVDSFFMFVILLDLISLLLIRLLWCDVDIKKNTNLAIIFMIVNLLGTCLAAMFAAAAEFLITYDLYQITSALLLTLTLLKLGIPLFYIYKLSLYEGINFATLWIFGYIVNFITLEGFLAQIQLLQLTLSNLLKILFLITLVVATGWFAINLRSSSNLKLYMITSTTILNSTLLMLILTNNFMEVMVLCDSIFLFYSLISYTLLYAFYYFFESTSLLNINFLNTFVQNNIIILVSLLNLSGIPPFSMFFFKYSLLQTIFSSFGNVILSAVVLLLSLISLYVYILLFKKILANNKLASQLRVEPQIKLVVALLFILSNAQLFIDTSEYFIYINSL